MYKRIIFAGILIILIINFSGQAQEKKTVLTKADKKQAIEKVCQLINKFYVYPEVASEMEKHIKSKLKERVFENVSNPDEFVSMVTHELRSVNNDKHLKMFIGSNPDEHSAQERNIKKIMNRLKAYHFRFNSQHLDINDTLKFKLKTLKYSQKINLQT